MVGYFDELVKFIDAQIKDFDTYTRAMSEDALNFHRTHCPNPPGSSCENHFTQLYLQLWEERELVRKIKSGEARVVFVNKKEPEEERSNGGYV